jgi:transposase InsO family protein
MSSGMPRGYPSEFRRKVLDLLQAGRSVAELVRDPQISDQTIYNWRRQDLIDTGRLPGVTSSDQGELVAARRRIAELETELAIHRRATELLKEVVPPKGRYAVIQTMTAEGLPVEVCCRVLDVSVSGYYYAWRLRPPSARSLRHVWLTEHIQAVHAASRGAEAVRDAIAATMTTLPDQLRRTLTWDRGKELAQHVQLRIDSGVRVYFADPHSPWQRGTNENTNGLLRQYFPKGTDLARRNHDDLAAVAATLNSRPRKTLGWKTPAEHSTNSYSVFKATVLRRPVESGQFTSWAFTRRVQDAGLAPSMGSIGDCYDNTMMESFWARMQTEPVDRQRWNTRIELANAIFDYLEIFHNRQRRRSALGMLTPIEYETPPPATLSVA